VLLVPPYRSFGTAGGRSHSHPDWLLARPRPHLRPADGYGLSSHTPRSLPSKIAFSPGL
jgi:hypothetical protein